MHKKPEHTLKQSAGDDLIPKGNAKRIPEDIPRPKDAIFIRRLEIKPKGQIRTPLGSFATDSEPKGFLVEVDPDPAPANSVTTKITSLESGPYYSLHLHIANASPKTVQADVWRL